MLLHLIIGLSVVVQLASAFFAIRLIRVAKGAAWAFISISILLMEVRRVFSLLNYTAEDIAHGSIAFELVGLATSAFMLLGVVLIAPIFRSMRRAEDELRKSGKKLSDVTSYLGEGIYTLDARGAITFMNPMAEKLMGWTMEELNEKGPHELVHFRRADGTPLPAGECMMHGVALSGMPYISTDEVFVRKDGTVFPISVITTPIVEGGRVTASVTAFRDISDLKQVEGERERLILELQEALANVKTLTGLLPVCAWCGKVRDDEGYWTKVEEYVEKHTDASFTHGICPVCLKRAEEEYKDGKV